MLLIRVRVSPCKAPPSRASPALTRMVPSATSTLTWGCRSRLSVPLPPLTSISCPLMLTVTPLVIWMGLLPTRDMEGPPRQSRIPCRSLPDLAENFPTHLLLPCLPVREDTFGGGENYR